jgi:hypothetical protein
MRFAREVRRSIPLRALLLVSFAAFVLHMIRFGTWMIDDAGISLAYARTLASGYGLRAQPGVPPVEGFSNPLWTLLLAGFARSDTFDVLWTPKALSLALVAATFLLIARTSEGRGRPLSPAALPLLLLPLNTSFVVWTTSGLENALLAFLVVAACSLAIRAAEGAQSWEIDAGSGLVAALLALTRPDAVVYALAYPLVLLAGARRHGAWRSTARRLAFYGLGLGPALGAYLVFRATYYGDWAPNTYYAKDRPSLLSLMDLGKLFDLLQSALGPVALLLPVLLVGCAVLLLWCARLQVRQCVLGLYLGLATFVYLVLPLDWMGEYRFATAFFVFLYWTIGELFCEVVAMAPAAWPRRPWVGWGFVAALLLVTSGVYAERSLAFAEAPVVPFRRVAAFSGTGYNKLAAIIGRPDASLLTPDLGGTLYYSTMRVYDLAGLCDRVVARTLRTDHQAFLDYVFERARPTFIHVHASWAEWARFPDDPRLARSYVPISERWDGPSEWVAHAPKNLPWSADYVRRDAIEANPALLERLRATFRERGMPSLSP